MKKLTVLFAAAITMYLPSESNDNLDDEVSNKSAEVTYFVSEERLKEYEELEKKRSAEAQRILDEGYRDKDDYSGPSIISPEYSSRSISGNVLVSDLTVSQLRGIIKDVVKNSLRECETTAVYATGTKDRTRWWQDTDTGLSKHRITCKR